MTFIYSHNNFHILTHNYFKKSTTTTTTTIIMSNNNCLLLGFTNDPAYRNTPQSAQRFRDTVRVDYLQEILNSVAYTLDNKNEPTDTTERHIRADFADYRRMAMSMTNNWGFIDFNMVFLDYFFCPVSYLLHIPFCF